MTNPISGLQYLVAFQNNAMDDPNLITTIASPPGTLGGVNVWTDITQFVMTDSGSRGRQHELQQFEAATRQMDLVNFDGRFTPNNAGSPYYPYVTIRKPFQVRSNWSSVNYGRYTGQVSSWGTSWPDQGFSQYSVLQVSDAFRMFNLADITTGGYPAQVIADGATGYWRLGDVVGSTIAADSSGHGNTGTVLTNGGTVTFGATGELISNPGTSCAIVYGNVVPLITGIQLPTVLPATPTAVTIEFWVESSDTSINASTVAVQYGSGSSIYNWQINIGSSAGVIIRDNNTLSLLVNLAANYYNGVPHYFVITLTSTTLTLYVDSQFITSTTSLPTAGTNSFGTPSNIIANFSTAAPTDFQEVAIYNGTALTPTQITNHFQLAAWPQEGTGARISRVLNSLGWSSGARAIDTGKSTVQAQTSSLTSTSALSHMQSVEATEGGALFMTVDGKVRFYARTSLQSAAFTTTNQAQFGDNTAAGDIPFQPAPTLAMDDIDLYNEAVATRTGGNVQIYNQGTGPGTSIGQNGRVTWNPPATLLGISDAEVLAMCQYVVTKYSTAVNRLSAITVDVVSVANTFPAAIPALLSLDLLYQVTVERTITPGGGTFTQTCDIEHIAEVINAKAGTWTITFGMEISDPIWWVLGTAQLGQTTRLAW